MLSRFSLFSHRDDESPGIAALSNGIGYILINYKIDDGETLKTLALLLKHDLTIIFSWSLRSHIAPNQKNSASIPGAITKQLKTASCVPNSCRSFTPSASFCIFYFHNFSVPCTTA